MLELQAQLNTPTLTPTPLESPIDAAIKQFRNNIRVSKNISKDIDDFLRNLKKVTGPPVEILDIAEAICDLIESRVLTAPDLTLREKINDFLALLKRYKSRLETAEDIRNLQVQL